MAEDEKDDVRRVQFILNEKDLQLERSEDATLFSGLDTSPEAILENPINLLLSNFDNEYMERERMGVVMFDYLHQALTKYQNLVNNHFYYQDLEIINVVNDLLSRYMTWMANQRGVILTTRDLVRNIREMLEEKYITKDALDKFREEMKFQIESEEKTFEEAMVGKVGNDMVVVLPKNTKFKKDDFVKIKKSKNSK